MSKLTFLGSCDLVWVVGESNVFVSIYESNSVDDTQRLVAAFEREPARRQIRHRIISDQTKKSWRNSWGRIIFLQGIRNRALEPLASSDEEVRLLDVEEWADGRVVFLNDTLFEWQDVIRLLDDRTDGGHKFDLISGTDFHQDGEIRCFTSVAFAYETPARRPV